MAGCLISPVQEIGKCILTECVWPPIKCHFDYWWWFDDNIQGLGDGIEELKRQKHYIEQKSEESNFERCKVVLTSRSRDTCKRIKNKVVFDLKILEEEEEAWILFKENAAGKCVEDSALYVWQKMLRKNAKVYLLVTVGIALQDETNDVEGEVDLACLLALDFMRI